MRRKTTNTQNSYQDILNRMALLERENLALKKTAAHSSDRELAKAMQEAVRRKSAPVVMEPNRDYVKEVVEALANRTKGLKDPEFQLLDGEIVVIFDDLGPRYKLKVYGPIRRLRTAKARMKPLSEYRKAAGG